MDGIAQTPEEYKQAYTDTLIAQAMLDKLMKDAERINELLGGNVLKINARPANEQIEWALEFYDEAVELYKKQAGIK